MLSIRSSHPVILLAAMNLVVLSACASKDNTYEDVGELPPPVQLQAAPEPALQELEGYWKVDRISRVTASGQRMEISELPFGELGVPDYLRLDDNGQIYSLDSTDYQTWSPTLNLRARDPQGNLPSFPWEQRRRLVVLSMNEMLGTYHVPGRPAEDSRPAHEAVDVEIRIVRADAEVPGVLEQATQAKVEVLQRLAGSWSLREKQSVDLGTDTVRSSTPASTLQPIAFVWPAHPTTGQEARRSINVLTMLIPNLMGELVINDNVRMPLRMGYSVLRRAVTYLELPALLAGSEGDRVQRDGNRKWTFDLREGGHILQLTEYRYQFPGESSTVQWPSERLIFERR
jgi:hypothetical protein